MPTAVEGASKLRLFSLPHFIARRTAIQPDTVAVKATHKQLTYRELNHEAERYARFLRNANVQPGSVVAVCMDRSPESLAAMLGIWKVGAAYLALDTICPPERAAFMLEDADARLAIAGKAHAALLRTNARKILLAEEIEQAGRWGDDDQSDFPVSGDCLAYVLYTSGSTGKPKGVEVCHGGLANVVTAIADELQLRPGEVLLGCSSPGFDISNLEIYLPLVSGGSLHIAENTGPSDCARLMRTLTESGATTMLGTCTLWRLLLEAGWEGKADLRVISGGEILTPELARALCERSAGLWNQYGPTEATICATTERVDPETDKVTIGRPIAHVDMHILDADLQPVANGATGEICIGGAGVARGYRGRPELSAARFVSDPFSAIPGGRLYKTGDLGRRLLDGRLEFIGRLDNQVKIHGCRIELEEIEEQIRQCPGVKAAVVLALPRETGDSRLVAWIEAKNALTSDFVRNFLKRRVPAYMIPSEFRQTDSLPLNKNGKIDRNLLRARSLTSTAGEGRVSERKNTVESRLRSIWEDLLQTKPISLKDNFFDVGGDSLLAVRLVTRIELSFGRKISPEILLGCPTLGGLAARIEAEETEVGFGPLVALRRSGRQAPFFVVHGLGGSVLSFRELAACLGDDRPVFGVVLPDGPVSKRDEIDIKTFASKCVSEIKRLFPTGPYHLSGHSFGSLIAFEIAVQLSGMGERAGILALLDSDLNFGRSKPAATSTVAERSALLWRRYRLKLESLAENGVAEVLRRRVAHEKLHRRVRLAQQTGDGEFGERSFDAKELLVLAGARYNPARYAGPSVLFKAKEEARSKADAAMGWAELMGSDLEIVDIPGKHMTILDQPHVARLAAELTQRMESSC